MKDDLRHDIHRNAAELEREADRARMSLEHTLEALERKLSPGELLDQFLGTMKHNGGDFGRNLLTQVRNNPVPVLLTGVGLTWLISTSDRPPQPAAHGSGPSLGERASSAAAAARGAAGQASSGARSAAEGARGAMGSAAEHTRHALEGMAGSTRHTAQSVAEASRTGMHSLAEGFDYLRREQPLVLGAIGVAAGALIGAMFPATAAEDEWIGERRDETLDRLKEEGQRTVEEAKGAAADAAEAARQAAQPKRAGRADTGGGNEGVASGSE